MVRQPHIRPLSEADRAAALEVINTAAQWYHEFLPPEELHSPEMTPEQWDAEARRMTWYGAFADGALVAVMGLEARGDAALVRHGYVLPQHQRHGVGGTLLAHLERAAGVPRVIIGTYAANYKARASLENAGYRLCPDSPAVLARYYELPADRARASVAYEKLVPQPGSNTATPPA
ncbi:MAG TPA: GNAT family N-acetyltransferase [Burkholderiales bacterium]|nr:GNAT family N-acetyltransferase [Burkholderiales bacterium]